jgi:hypothetical protein
VTRFRFLSLDVCQLAFFAGLGLAIHAYCRGAGVVSEKVAWRAHTYEVKLAIGRVLVDLLDVEAGRGPGIAKVEADVGVLRDLTADNPGQQARLAAMGPLLARLRAAPDRDVVARVRLRLDQLNAEEDRLLGERTADLDDGVARSLRSARVATLPAVGLFIAWWLARRRAA